MKTVSTIASLFLLSGCVVGSRPSSDFDYVPYIQTFQKIGREGHTDPTQRKKDMYSCGVDKNASLDDGRFSGSSAYPGESFQQVIARTDKVENCMKKKGYVIFGYDECGPLKAPTGLCN